jgi:putative transposase
MIWTALPCAFSSVSVYRLQKIMRGLGIRGCTPHSSKRTTVQDPRAEEKRDFIGRDFTSPIPTYKLIGDTTYLKTGQGWLYFACVIDLYTRMVMCWALSLRMTADILISALECAKAQGYVADNAIFHSDEGSLYTSHLLLDWSGQIT